jgi:hypothetical protein
MIKKWPPSFTTHPKHDPHPLRQQALKMYMKCIHVEIADLSEHIRHGTYEILTIFDR